MGVQSYDETSLADGKVPGGGMTSPAQPTSPAKATGIPRAVDQADGTANLRADQQTRMAAAPTTPTKGAKVPAGVDHYTDDGA